MKLTTALFTKPEFKASQRINVTRRHKVLNNYMVCPETNPSDFPLNLPSGPLGTLPPVVLRPHSFLLRSINLFYLDRLVFIVYSYIVYSILIDLLFTLRNSPCTILGRTLLLFINDPLYVYRCIAHDFMLTPCLFILWSLTFFTIKSTPSLIPRFTSLFMSALSCPIRF